MSLEARYRRLVPYVLAAYFGAVIVFFLYLNMRFNVEWVALVLLGAAILSGRGLLFIRDWGVLFIVLLAWQVTSGMATQFAFPEHVTELINADRLLFGGTVPAVWLQSHLYDPGHLQAWDVLAASMYLLHFLAPLAAGFLIWLTNRELFRRFAIAFVLVALAGFTTYILYPADPPWRASLPLVLAHGRYYAVLHGMINVNGHFIPAHNPHIYLSGVKNLFNDVMSRWYNPYNGTIFLPFVKLHYDQVGAIPSEHAAYPLLFFLFLRKQFGRWSYLSLVYIAGILFSITYLGQHYVVDALVGFAYALGGYAFVMHVMPYVLARLHRIQRHSPRRVTRVGRAELEEA